MRTYRIYPKVFPEPWALGWGEDQFGLWMAVTYKGARLQFRWIEPGTFLMGSPENEVDRLDYETQHKVTLTQGFWMADTTVTQALWEAVMGYNPSSFKGPNRPVENINWHDAQNFIEQINTIKPELKLCIPSEAQWEYACRAGTTSPFNLGDHITSECVNFNGNHPYNKGKKSEYCEQTVDVQSFPPNDWGLFEMHGNVWEWCQDWFEGYAKQPIIDPCGPKSGLSRVLRGGSWFSDEKNCRSAYRNYWEPVIHDSFIGFRLARGH